MKYEIIRHTDLKVSTLALGLMRIADKSVEEAAKIIQSALDSGINFFDHADIYGKGQSEIIFSKAMKTLNVPRSSYVLQSKCGIRPDISTYDFSYSHIIEAVDDILTRLDTPYLDILLLHRPDILWDPKEVNRAFKTLYDEGKVKYFGVSNMNVQQLTYLQENLDFKIVANQLQFSIMHADLVSSGVFVNMRQNHEQLASAGLLDYMRHHDIQLQAWSPFQYGFFEGVFIDNPKFVDLNHKLQEIADKYKVTKISIAVAWINTHPADTVTIIGTMNPQRIKESSLGADVQLTRQEWYEIYNAAGHTLP